MFLSAKTKQIFVDFGDHVVLVAKTSSARAPFVVEDIRECPVGDEAALAAALVAMQTQKNAGGLTHANCAIYTSKRVIRKIPLDIKKLKEPTYLNELAGSQLRIDPEKYTMALLNAVDGLEYDMVKASQKDAIFCGLPVEDINRIQDRLLAGGIYPERLELGTVATIGALVDYLNSTQAKAPVLMLEIDADSTNSFIVTPSGLEVSRPIFQGLEAMIPVVQAELGLRDAESARKLFLSNAFDFTGMGPALVKKLIRELQSFIGFYEVQTGQSIGEIICTVLPSKLGWIEETIASQLSVTVLKIDMPAWLQTRQITLADSLPVASQDARRFGLFGLMAQYGNHALNS